MQRARFYTILAILATALVAVTAWLVWTRGLLWAFLLAPVIVLAIGILAHVQGASEEEGI